MTAPPVFPTLNPGWSQIKRPKAGANLIAMSGTGRVVRATLWTFPLWEWDITWEYLPDDQAYGVTLSDFKDLLGFFLRATGMFGGFCYQDQDENSVTGQYIGLGDGVTTTFALSKTFGLGGTRTEPIGYLNLVPGFNAYVNGVFVNPLLYTLSQQFPVAQTITFADPPPGGVAVTVDMSFYYWVHFKDDVAEFENFAHRLWSAKKLTLESLRQQ